MRSSWKLYRKIFFAVLFSPVPFFVLASAPQARAADPWTPAQVIQPSALAKQLTSGKLKPLILQVGFQILYKQSHIPGAEFCGPARDAAGIEKLRKCVANVPHSREIVIYCGCCPWEQCPNVRPAYAELKKLGFKNLHVLDIPQNFGDDWVKRGYPVTRGE